MAVGRKCASVHSLRSRGARRKAGVKAKTFADDQRFPHILAPRTAKATHKPRDQDRVVGNSVEFSLSDRLTHGLGGRRVVCSCPRERVLQSLQMLDLGHAVYGANNRERPSSTKSDLRSANGCPVSEELGHWQFLGHRKHKQGRQESSHKLAVFSLAAWSAVLVDFQLGRGDYRNLNFYRVVETLA